MSVVVGSAGCLRLTTDLQPEDEGASTTTREPATAANAGTESNAASDLDGFFKSESEALAHASQFANDAARKPVQTTVIGEQKLLRFTGAGSSGSGTGSGGRYSSQDLQIASQSPSGVVFGTSDRTLRVRNVTFGTAAQFIPAEEAELDVTEFEIDAETEGIPPERIRVEIAGSDERRYIEGRWNGNTDLFREQPFSLYVVELLEGTRVIGRSEGSVRGIRYQWGSEQTRESLYITRHPSVSREWTAEFALTGIQHEFEPIKAEHLPDKDVFRVDLTKLDVSPGQYQGSLEITNGESGLENIYLSVGRLPLIVT